MTCKDCLYFNMCYVLADNPEEAEVERAETDCSNFADRSRYVVREKGEWDDSGRYKFVNGGKAIRCPFCGSCLTEEEYDLYFWNFCPYCGSDMRKRENG